MLTMLHCALYVACRQLYLAHIPTRCAERHRVAACDHRVRSGTLPPNPLAWMCVTRLRALPCADRHRRQNH